MIKLEHVDKYFGDLHVLKDVNLEVAEGEKLVIIGPSGSGKSTTVRCMNFLEEPTSGHVYIDGQELTNKNKTRIVRDNMSMVFQQFNLYPHMTVLKNLTLAPMKLHHKTKQRPKSWHIIILSRRPPGQSGCLPSAAVRRPAAAHRHCTRPLRTDQDHPVRRADFGPRP